MADSTLNDWMTEPKRRGAADEEDEDFDGDGDPEADAALDAKGLRELDDLKDALLDVPQVVLRAADMLDPAALLAAGEDAQEDEEEGADEPDAQAEARNAEDFLEAVLTAVELLPPPVVRALQAHEDLTPEDGRKVAEVLAEMEVIEEEDVPIVGAFLAAAASVAEKVQNVQAAPEES
jgi:DNA-directed RNA polymerase specialized sigma24 family protein